MEGNLQRAKETFEVFGLHSNVASWYVSISSRFKIQAWAAQTPPCESWRA